MKLSELIESIPFDKQDYKALKQIIAYQLDMSFHQIHSQNPKLSEKDIQNIQNDYDLYKNQNKPLSYIIQETDFYNHKFKVNQNTLIPRPESETFIDIIKTKLKNSSNKYHIIDVGTGSWALGISAILNSPNSSSLKQCALLDISSKALSIAKVNYNRLISNKPNLPKIYIQKSNLLERYFENISKFPLLNNIIIANLPYISPKGYEKLPDKIKKREPPEALLAWKNWLKYYKQLINQILEHNTNKNYELLLEVTPKQIKLLKQKYNDQNINFTTHSTCHFNIKILEVQIKL